MFERFDETFAVNSEKQKKATIMCGRDRVATSAENEINELVTFLVDFRLIKPHHYIYISFDVSLGGEYKSICRHFCDVYDFKIARAITFHRPQHILFVSKAFLPTPHFLSNSMCQCVV